MGCLQHLLPHAALNSGRLSCARCSVKNPLFEQAGGRAMRLEVCAVDHDPLGLRTFTCKTGEEWRALVGKGIGAFRRPEEAPTI